MDISDYRKQIDDIDEKLAALFNERMAVSAKIVEFKREKGLPVLDHARERQKLQSVTASANPALEEYAHMLFSLLIELSRTYQSKLLERHTPLYEEINRAIAETDKLFPQSAMVACQGVEGAYSQIACQKLFKRPQIMYFKSFEAVFSAIENGFCRYGILPVENSTAGSVNEVYNLMQNHNFRIVRSVRLKVDHCLVAKKGVQLGEIKEIFSHEQAISQCAGYLSKLGDKVKVTCCENTAAAAAAVANSDRRDIAALSSRSCIDLYGLSCLASSVQDRDNNYTRFICISKKLEIYPGADRTSLMMVVSHKPGSLYKTLARFYSLGLNLNKLESRPLPDREFEFMFYFDLESSVYSKEFAQLMDELSEDSEDFKYLGSYSEVI